jgi:hypothetical protein
VLGGQHDENRGGLHSLETGNGTSRCGEAGVGAVAWLESDGLREKSVVEDGVGCSGVEDEDR